ncbi:MAG TPA: peptidoglycan editing factor PgeF [Bacillus sp. (in: firmicutes)]|uniref:peptidoglycan editing factor PgeF n=1 Tax=Bacillus litorisediminis TaxID=2922713 RepID=UPI001FAC27F8|nr:peptidoglycan editing factor PgeF [Bacillus litorisediminis]HWO77874.1 peptidoglycan editing factor PgeF [Bacillus sp. (in: firmicutes)]
MEPFQLQTEEYFIIRPWSHIDSSLVAGFTTRKNGVSPFPKASLNLAFHVGDTLDDVQSNRKKLSELLNFPVDYWVSTEQVHDTKIQTVSRETRGRGAFSLDDCIRETDGLLTNEKGVLLTLCYADCVPVYFFDPVSKWIGVAHAGWKGTTRNIAGKMVKMLQEKGVSLSNLKAAIGPSICKTCYIVDDRVVDAVRDLLEENDEKPYNEVETGQYQLDLKQLNLQLLKKAGIQESNIAVTNYCSSCDSDWFFSHRRDRGITGRMLSFIGWRED